MAISMVQTYQKHRTSQCWCDLIFQISYTESIIMVLFVNYQFFFINFMTIMLLCFNKIISIKETLIKFTEFKLIMMYEKSLQCNASEFTHMNWVGQFTRI